MFLLTACHLTVKMHIFSRGLEICALGALYIIQPGEIWRERVTRNVTDTAKYKYTAGVIYSFFKAQKKVSQDKKLRLGMCFRTGVLRDVTKKKSIFFLCCI